MTAILDLKQRHWLRSKGPITIIGTWVTLGDSQRPCMVLIRTGEEAGEHTVPCIITADKAWIWSEDIGDPGQAARMAFSFCEALRLGNEPMDIMRLAGIVHDHLGDLLTIPPHPPIPATAVADVTITERDTGKTTEVVL